ncbi:MFS transporter [Paenibacillus sp. LjRoot153]|uniref:MFS transporter n=1 Tax=Paenibacillus sp. LjRoot153 TaxID=3342270 RepID=UPI003ECEC83B
MSVETEDKIKSLAYNLHGYIDSLEMQRRLYKRTLIIVAISQIFGGAGLAAGVTVGALLAQDMLGTDNFAGIPTALFTLGSAAAALFVGRLSQRFGRRLGLATGFLIGGIGSIGIVIAAVADNILLLFATLLIYGAGNATNLQARYAGTDLAKPTQRGTAVSIAMVSTTVGAIAGPNTVDVMGRFAMLHGIPSLAGPFILAAAAFILAGGVLLVLLRPDPLVTANAIAKGQKSDQSATADKKNIKAFNNSRIIVGATVMIVTQIVMTSIMTMTPIHLKNHGHGLGEVGLVIGIHIGAMYLPSLVTGILVDKIGRIAMSFATGAILLTAGIVAAVATTDSTLALIIALALLGLGWNFGFISGTALIVDATHPATRAKTQGTVDVLIALAGASGGALSGILVAHSSYALLSLGGGILSLLLIPVVIWSGSKRNRKIVMS